MSFKLIVAPQIYADFERDRREFCENFRISDEFPLIPKHV